MSILESEYGLVEESSQILNQCRALPSLTEVDRLLFATSGDGGLSEFYNGKIEMPAILNVAQNFDFDPDIREFVMNPDHIVAKWDFSEGSQHSNFRT